MRGIYESRSFNVVTYGPPSHIAVRNTWKLQKHHEIIYNWCEIQSNPFSLSKVIESAGWFSYIHWRYYCTQNNERKKALK